MNMIIEEKDIIKTKIKEKNIRRKRDKKMNA